MVFYDFVIKRIGLYAICLMMAAVDSNYPSFCRRRRRPDYLLMSSVVSWK